MKALAAPGLIGKAASGPARTDTATWAAELSTVGVLDTLQIVAPASVYSQLSQFPGSIRADISGRSGIKVPSRTPSPSLTTPFVGEGSPIPVRQLALSSATITPKKAAVLSQFTEEMLKTSNAEKLIAAVLEFDTAFAIDGVLLGSAASSAIQPAGLLNGVSATPATSGGGVAAFAGDVRALAAAIEASGPLLAPVILMSVTSAMLIGSQRIMLDTTTPITLPIIAAPTVPAKRLIMLDAANFASAEGDEPEITTSKEVLIHEEDTAPLAIASGAQGAATLATPSRSAWQTNCLSIRLLQDCTWALTRSGRASYVDAVTW